MMHGPRINGSLVRLAAIYFFYPHKTIGRLMDKSRPIILKYVCGSESAESAAESATESAAESAEVAAHHHEVTAESATHVHLADLAALGQGKE